MRTYASNSPQAAARIVALTMLADGHFCKSEMDVLDRMNAHCHLEISPTEVQAVVQGLCEDLSSTSHQNWGVASLDSGTLAALLREIDDPALRITVLGLCTAVVEADAHYAEGEEKLLAALRDQWQLPSILNVQPSLAAVSQNA